VSSVYRVLCLSHDPAIELPGEEWLSGANGMELATRAMVERATNELRSHQGCDLLVGRFSYPLIEVGCVTSPTWPTDHGNYHNGTKWIDAEWLRLLYHAYNETGTALADVAAEMDRGCWSRQRVRRLRTLLRIA
jgi:hypothetical protein